MQVTIQRTKIDYKEFAFFYNVRRYIGIKILLPLAFAIFFYYQFPKIDFTRIDAFKTAIGFLILCYAFFIIIPYLISISRWKKWFPNGKQKLNDLTVSLIDTGVSFSTEKGTQTVLWKDLKSIENAKEYIIIKIKLNRHTIFIPKKYFESSEDADKFYSFLDSNFFQKYSTYRTNGKHLYAWGFLGLIPGWGVLAGLFLLNKGMNFYSNKKLILIGCVAILFTPVIILLLFSTSTFNYGPVSDFTEQQINTLVEKIEFYKLQYNKYPDSLEEIQRINDLTFINDPMSHLSKNGQTFQYKKINDKYTLFSVGKDGEPNTNDDIYPNITNGDTVKFGFVKR